MRQQKMRLALAASVTVHGMLLALILPTVPRMRGAPTPVQAVNVMLVAPQVAAVQAKSLATQRESAPTPPTVSSPASSPSGSVKASEFFAHDVLDQPRNKAAKAAIAGLAPDERLIQLCNVEAMQQVSHWRMDFPADNLVVYATASPKIDRTTLIANGAAVHSKGEWYRIVLKCSASADLTQITEFEFKLGKKIPREDWEVDSLPDLADGGD